MKNTQEYLRERLVRQANAGAVTGIHAERALRGANMSSLHWYPFYPSDYLDATYDLSFCEHGVYHLLLHRYWMSGPLRNDVDVLIRIAAGAPADMIRAILERYWTLTDSGWEQERMMRLRGQQLTAHQRRVEAGSMGGRQKSLNNQQPGSSNATAKPEHCSSIQIQNKKQKEKEIKNQSQRGEKIAPKGALSASQPTTDKLADVRQILDYLNSGTGRLFKMRNQDNRLSANAKLVLARLEEHTKGELLGVIDMQMREWGHSEKWAKYLRPSTLFGKTKCEQYVGALPTPGAKMRKWGSFLDDDDVLEGEVAKK